MRLSGESPFRVRIRSPLSFPEHVHADVDQGMPLKSCRIARTTSRLFFLPDSWTIICHRVLRSGFSSSDPRARTVGDHAPGAGVAPACASDVLVSSFERARRQLGRRRVIASDYHRPLGAGGRRKRYRLPRTPCRRELPGPKSLRARSTTRRPRPKLCSDGFQRPRLERNSATTRASIASRPASAGVPTARYRPIHVLDNQFGRRFVISTEASEGPAGWFDRRGALQQEGLVDQTKKGATATRCSVTPSPPTFRSWWRRRTTAFVSRASFEAVLIAG